LKGKVGNKVQNLFNGVADMITEHSKNTGTFSYWALSFSGFPNASKSS